MRVRFRHRSGNGAADKRGDEKMTIEQRKMAEEGRGYWMVYVQINGYAFYPTTEGLRKLARNLDLTQAYLAKRINAYLEA